MRGIEFDSPVKRIEQSDSDTDFQARGAESDGEESADEDGGEHVSPQKLQNAEARPSRGIVGSQGSPPSGKGMNLENSHKHHIPLAKQVPDPHELLALTWVDLSQFEPSNARSSQPQYRTEFPLLRPLLIRQWIKATKKILKRLAWHAMISTQRASVPSKSPESNIVACVGLPTTDTKGHVPI